MKSQPAILRNDDASVQVKVTHDREYDEYTCKIYINGKHVPARDYFTDEYSDAMTTANSMYSAAIKIL